MDTPAAASPRQVFRLATQWFVDTAQQSTETLDAPALGEWSVRDLIGHTSRALLTVESYLTTETGQLEVTSAADYFAAVLGADPATVAERGRQAGELLGAEPDVQVAAIAERVLALVEAASDDQVLTTPAGRMRLVDYLPTRSFELTVHTCDLAAALGLETEPPEAAVVEAMSVISQLALRKGVAAPLLRAVTGRDVARQSFSVL